MSRPFASFEDILKELDRLAAIAREKKSGVSLDEKVELHDTAHRLEHARRILILLVQRVEALTQTRRNA